MKVGSLRSLPATSSVDGGRRARSAPGRAVVWRAALSLLQRFFSGISAVSATIVASYGDAVDQASKFRAEDPRGGDCCDRVRQLGLLAPSETFPRGRPAAHRARAFLRAGRSPGHRAHRLGALPVSRSIALPVRQLTPARAGADAQARVPGWAAARCTPPSRCLRGCRRRGVSWRRRASRQWVR